MADVSEEKANPDLADCMVFNGKPSELYYFAYGSNMNKEQIHARCANPKVIAVAKLPHHRVAFFGYSKTWDGAMETVIPAPGQEVWGVIYELNFSDRDQARRLPGRTHGRNGSLLPLSCQGGRHGGKDSRGSLL